MAIITLAEAKAYLKIQPDVTDNDAVLQTIIDGATAAVKTFCRRSFEIGSYTEKYSGNGDSYLALKNSPIISVSNVNIGNVSTTDYEAGYAVIRKAGGWPDGMMNVEVSYTAGYAEVPADVVLALLIFVSTVYKADQSEYTTLFDNTGQYIRPESFPARTRSLLEPYKVVRI